MSYLSVTNFTTKSNVLKKGLMLCGTAGCIFIALLMLAVRGFASAPPVRFKHLTINEGLSQNTVYAILQDHEGFIWIGTEDGLNKYDGYEFTIYRHKKENTHSLSENQVNDILEDSKGNLWIATSDGLDLYNRRTDDFTRIYTISKKNAEAGDFITSLAADKEGRIWIGTMRGLKQYDPATKKIAFYQPGGQYNPSKKIQTLFIDATGRLWVGSDKELQLFDTRQQRFMPLPVVLAQNTTLKSSGIRRICRDGQGRYWLGTESAGVFAYDPVNNTCQNYRQQAGGLMSDIVRDVLIAGDDEVWIGTRDGLSVLKSGHFTNYQYDKYDAEGLSHNSIRHLMRDRSSNIWLGTYAGGVNVCYNQGASFEHIAEQIGAKPGLSHRVISAMIDNGDNSFWIGTEGGGLNYANLRDNVFHAYHFVNKAIGLNSDNVKSLTKDNRGNLWVGVYDGLICFNPTTQTQKIYRSAAIGKKPSENQVYALLADNDGIWIGTNGGGMQLMGYDGRIIKNYTHNQQDAGSISSDNVGVIRRDAAGNLWIGTQRGLNKLDPETGRFTHFKYSDSNPYSLPNNNISALYIDANQRVWVGTQSGGLSMLDARTNRFYSIDEKAGLANSVVHAIICDNTGNTWVSTNKGISKITFKSVAAPFASRPVIINYSVADGLLSNQFSSGSVVKDKSGTLYFGSISGVTYFNPADIHLNRFKPPVVLTDFLIRNTSAAIGADDSPLKENINEIKSITLTHDQAFISFKFAALSYISPDKNHYAYKLEGFNGDDDWHYVGSQRMATYTNLNAGTYYFKVRAANNDGIWNNDAKTIELIVLPPWYKTWWAYVIYALIIMGLLYVFYYYSVKTAKLKNALDFEHLSHEKDQELAQRKLTFFTNISHEIKTPLTLIMAPLEKLIGMNEGNNKIQNQLMLMQRNGERLIRLINQLLDFRKFESGNMALQAAEGNLVRFVNEIFIAFEPYALSKRISFKFNCSTEQLNVYFDRDKLEKILYNLLSNALKFTQEGGKIILSVKTAPAEDGIYHEGAALITVEDNGPGILPENQEKIFDRFAHFSDPKKNVSGTGLGLSFSKGLVELHRGAILVDSRPAVDEQPGNTCFTVKLPLGCAHLNPEEIVPDFHDSESIDQYYQPETTASALPLMKTAELSASEEDKPIMLIVEDNPDVLNFVALTFMNDYKVHTAENGLKGWELATTLIPDIVISDVMMPEMNGTMLCSKLKQDVRTSHIPVILLSARTPLVFKIEGLDIGADDYITKPFSVSILEARVRNLVDSRRKLRERYKKEISLQPRNIAITSPDEKFLTKVMNYIETNIAEPSLSVEELGKEIGMSRVTLYRKIKALTNQTAIEFIRSIRIKRAAQLLEQNKFNVNEVAYMVGFIDVDYFRKCFKEQFGHTPREYSGQAGEKG